MVGDHASGSMWLNKKKHCEWVNDSHHGLASSFWASRNVENPRFQVSSQTNGMLGINFIQREIAFANSNWRVISNRFIVFNVIYTVSTLVAVKYICSS